MAGFTFTADINDVVSRYELSDTEGFLYCLFESVSNSLYCGSKNRKIDITINLYREYKANDVMKMKNEDSVITGFIIADNGEGFTDENYEKFTKKIYKTNHEGGKGEGRIAFLKVFEAVEIESVFKESNKLFLRKFIFNRNSVRDNKKEVSNETPVITKIIFKKMKASFQNYTKKDIEYFSNEVLSHFYVHLHYLLEQKKKFEIRLIDDGGISEGIINTSKLEQDTVAHDNFVIRDSSGLGDINNIQFNIVHIKTMNIENNKAFYVVDERSAGEINNLDLPPGILEDKNGKKYYYNIYLKSSYFNKFLNESRTILSLPSDKRETENKYITKELIEQRLKEKAEEFLQYEIGILNQKNEQKVITVLSDEHNNKITNNKAFLYMLSDEEMKKKLLKKIKFSDTSRQVILKVKDFHEELQEETVKQINGMVELLKSDKKNKLNIEELEQKMQALAQKVNLANSVSLSSYIMLRKYVLTILGEGLNVYKNNNSQNETFFHNLLLMKGTNNTMDSNLWLLDDMFLYFDGTSEVAIEDITIKGEKIIRDLSDEERKELNQFNKKRLENRIDLLFFPDERKCIIIELKDPKVGIGDNITQMDRYAQYIANFVRPEYAIENFYTYLITDNFTKFDKPGNGYRRIHGINGFVRNAADIKSFDNDDITIANQYSEVIRYTDIYERAKMRNKIYFSKLNIQDDEK
jgi:hypothetical protein